MELIAQGYVAYTLMENRFGIKVMVGKEYWKPSLG